MLELGLKVIALAGFVGSLAVLGIWVPDLDLMAVITVVVTFVLYDFFGHPYRMRNRRNRPPASR